MASSTTHFSLFLFLITLSSSLHAHARNRQFFNKASAAKQPDFLRENDNSYGLYGDDSSHLPHSATTNPAEKPIHDYFPKNYNPVAYVTATEDDESRFTSNNNMNYLYNGGGSFNRDGLRPQGMSDTRFMENGRYFYDVNAEKHRKKNVGMREDQTRNENYNDVNFYGNNEFNGEGFESQDEFEDEVKNLP